jgi:hypothetical protein
VGLERIEVVEVMVSEPKSHESNDRIEFVFGKIVRHTGQIGIHVATLVELQCRLAVEDLAKFKERAFLPGVAIVVGLLLATASLPVGVVTVALVLKEVFAISYVISFAVVVSAAAIVSLMLVLIGASQISKQLKQFERSKRELNLNLCLLRRLLSRSSLQADQKQKVQKH